MLNPLIDILKNQIWKVFLEGQSNALLVCGMGIDRQQYKSI